MRYKLLIEYDGTDFKGWQTQPKQRTVQGELEKALAIIFQQKVRVNGSGRTDAGVHAKGQVAHIDIDVHIDKEKVIKSLNRLLNGEIVVHKMTKVSKNFDSRFDASERMYRYYISEKPFALNRQFVFSHQKKVDLKLLNEYALSLIGTHDFTAFSKTRSSVDHYKSIVYEANWKRKNDKVIFEISAIRFLRGMVRAIVGMSLLYEQQGKSVEEFKKILISKDRHLARFHAPAHGLVLERVSYKKREN